MLVGVACRCAARAAQHADSDHLEAQHEAPAGDGMMIAATLFDLAGMCRVLQRSAQIDCLPAGLQIYSDRPCQWNAKVLPASAN